MAKETDKGSGKTPEKAEKSNDKTEKAKEVETKASAAPKSSAEAKKSAKEAKAAPKSEAKAAHKKEKAKRPSGTPRAKLNPRTFLAKVGEVKSDWKLIDVDGQTLGRVSTYIASTLMGKLKPTYTRSTDTGDFVVVVNAEKVVLTGNKWNDKLYQYHTNYPGGLKTFTAKQILEKHPERLIKLAVYRMLPKGHMGRTWFSKLKVYQGSEHPHKAQKPVPVNLPKSRHSERV